MFRSSLILLTLLPVSLEAFVITPSSSVAMTSSRLMMTPAEEQDDVSSSDESTTTPFYFENEDTTALVEETKEWAEEAIMEDLEQQAVDLNTFMDKIPQVKLPQVGEIKDKAQAFLEDERVQDGIVKAKDAAMTTKTKVVEFFQDAKVKDITVKAKDVAVTTKTKVVEFFQDDQVKDVTAKAKDLMQDGFSRVSQVVESTFGTILKELKKAKTEDKE